MPSAWGIRVNAPDHQLTPATAEPELAASSRHQDAAAEVVQNAEIGADRRQVRTPAAAEPTDRVRAMPKPWRHPLSAMGWICQTALGIVSLIVLLAIVAAVPILQFAALGYLLDVEGRIGRSGRLRDAVPLARFAPRLGAVVLGIWLCVLPLRLLTDAVTDALLIDPASSTTSTLETIHRAAVCVVAVHLLLALANGGSLGCFFRPIRNIRRSIASVRRTDFLEDTAQKVRDSWRALRLKHFFWLGLRGYVGCMVWLIIPTALFAFADKTEGGPILVTLFGGFCLMIVLSWLPFLQARFATENRFRALFELSAVRQLFTRAPLAWLVAILAAYALALPLYLLKVALVPRDAMWFVTILFIVSIYPAKVIVGWAYHRAVQKQQQAWFGFRWTGRALLIPVLGAYVFLLFFTQFIGEQGKQVLFEHHALLLPVPF